MNEIEDGLAKAEVLTNLLNSIEEARAAGLLGNAAASAASYCVALEGDDAELANRMFRGPDPFLLDKLSRGEVSDKVRAAHFGGPGVYAKDDPERPRYLCLISLSADESTERTLARNISDTAQALFDLGALDTGYDCNDEYLEEIREIAEEKIMNTPTVVLPVGGVHMQVGTSDRVFAKAYWGGQKCAGVYHVHPIQGPGILVGCDQTTLAELGIKVDRVIKPDLGVITDADSLETVRMALASLDLMETK